ncbi:C40 family peptidase [Macrococcus equipercicus]|uniref:C40 family peptidase n=1 Tax=Macrococcus equipercicus TaxID=69967 RepID=A0A9Q9BTR6_9STAP|nr:NlpC/P60 family protein [Macrococcus equipercicus]UTH14229.1 C40 family peptidase [Macrococcus equipercicus]
MKKTLLAVTTAALLTTGIAAPVHEADAVRQTVTYKKASGNYLASVARSIAAKRIYKYGANNNYAVDCSAFAQQVMSAVGKRVPRTTHAQIKAGRRVYNPQAGDLVFFNRGTHVGVYIGNGQMVDALNPVEGVKERSIYYINGTITGFYRYY